MFTINGIRSDSFQAILEYFYTGAVTIRDDNVFELFETLQFLQVKTEKDQLPGRCIKWMISRLESHKKLDACAVVKVKLFST